MDFKLASSVERRILDFINIGGISREDKLYEIFQKSERGGYCKEAIKTALIRLLEKNLLQILRPLGNGFRNLSFRNTYYLARQDLFYEPQGLGDRITSGYKTKN
jgi:hypothetical protein